MSFMLAPGPEGPVSTARLEVFTEGTQECEARIFIERALTDDRLRQRLGAELAERCQALLDTRQRCMWRARGASEQDIEAHGTMSGIRTFLKVELDAEAGHEWFVGSGWRKRSQELYETAGEVARRLGAS
jgi:hypothetical protein